MRLFTLAAAMPALAVGQQYNCTNDQPTPLADVLSAIPDKHTVQHISCPRSNLLGQLPSDLSQFVQLTRLDLHDNDLTGTIPPWNNHKVPLRSINLSQNRLTGVLPQGWAEFSNLTHIMVENNRIQGSLPTEWSTMKMLLVLEANDNQLTGQFPSDWESMRYLQAVSLVAGNKLTGTIPFVNPWLDAGDVSPGKDIGIGCKSRNQQGECTGCRNNYYGTTCSEPTSCTENGFCLSDCSSFESCTVCSGIQGNGTCSSCFEGFNGENCEVAPTDTPTVSPTVRVIKEDDAPDTPDEEEELGLTRGALVGVIVGPLALVVVAGVGFALWVESGKKAEVAKVLDPEPTTELSSVNPELLSVNPELSSVNPEFTAVDPSLSL